MANTVEVQIIADVRDMVRGVNQTTAELDGLGNKAQKAGNWASGMVKGFIGLQVVQVAAQAIGATVSAASDLQQSMGAVETVFGDYAAAVTSNSKKAADNFGLSMNQYNESASLLGTMLGNQNLTMDETVKKTDNMIGVASDLAATYGGTVQESVSAVTAAYKGEFEQLERYGVSIKASDISARLAAKGQSELEGEARKAAESIAAEELLLEQASPALGAFSRESDTLAGQQAILSAKFEDVKAKIGEKLLPILTTMGTWILEEGIPALEKFGKWFGENIQPTLEAFWKTFKEDILPIVIQLFNFWKDNLLPIMMKFYEILYGTIIPIIAKVVGAIAGFLKGVVDFVKGANEKWNEFKNKVTEIKNDFIAKWNAIVAFVRGIPGQIQNFFAGIANWFRNKFGEIKQGVVDKFNEVVDFARSIPGRIMNAIGDVGSLLRSVGSKIIQGLINGITSKFSDVKNTLGNLTGKLTSWKGPESLDKVILQNAGELVIGGFINGLESQYSNVKKSLAGLTNNVANTTFGSPAFAGGSGFNSGGMAPTIIINAGLGTDPVELENAVARGLKGYTARNGKEFLNRL